MIDNKHVLISGGGLGGLCLAQGLIKSGIPCRVLERDAGSDSREQGYRININPSGSGALKECLPPERFDLFLKTCAKSDIPFSFATSGMRKLLSFDMAGAGNLSVNRQILREVLLAGIEDHVFFGARVVGYETCDGGVQAICENGSRFSGDLLIGADGVNSPVRKQLLPDAEPKDTGVIGIACPIPLDAHGRELTTDALLQGTGLFFGKEGYTVFFARHEFTDEARSAMALLGKEHVAQRADDYALWALICPREIFGPNALQMSGEELKARSLGLTRDWHPKLRRLVQESDSKKFGVINLRAASRVDKLRSGPVTLLGDAIHSMPPTGGNGGNTALRDAQTLLRCLLNGSGIAAYEPEMLEYGFDAVDESLGILSNATMRSRFRQLARAGFFMVADQLPGFKRKVFGS